MVLGGYAARRPWEGEYFKAVREGLFGAWASVEEYGGLPTRVFKEFDLFLHCGNPAFGVVQVYCPDCRNSSAVAFSCKGNLCPSCTNRRAEEAVAQWNARLPKAAYRMWTLSLPRKLRFLVLKHRSVFLHVQKSLVQAVGCWQRKQARRYVDTQQLKTGALVFVQLFGSALQLTPHFHVLVPEAVWMRDGQRVDIRAPDEKALESILLRLLRQLKKKLSDIEFDVYPEDGHDMVQLEAIQQKLPFKVEEVELPKARKPMVAVMEGFSLHAGRRIHENDRDGLCYVIRYSARGPVSQKRVSRLSDGRVRYETKNGKAVHFSPQAFVKRLAALAPPIPSATVS